MPDKARPPRASTAASLLTLGGQPAPSGMGASLAKVLLLQAAASADFDAILLGNIDPETTDDTVQLAARRFCREHEAELEDVYAAVQACRILLCGAARWNVHEAELKQDLATLVPDALLEPLLERLIPLYTQIFEPLRQQAVLRSLVEHSEVVRGIKWRVDVLKHSEHALEMNVPVATLSFACQHGDESKTVSLQLLPAELRTLRDTCNNILG